MLPQQRNKNGSASRYDAKVVFHVVARYPHVINTKKPQLFLHNNTIWYTSSGHRAAAILHIFSKIYTLSPCYISLALATEATLRGRTDNTSLLLWSSSTLQVCTHSLQPSLLSPCPHENVHTQYLWLKKKTLTKPVVPVDVYHNHCWHIWCD